MNPYLTILKSLVSKTSHGRATNFTLPRNSSVSGTTGARDIGFSLDAAIVKYMRSREVPVPTLTAVMASGFGGPPIFSSLAPDVHPALASTIIAQALTEKVSTARLDLSKLIATIAQKHKIPAAAVATLVSAGEEVHKKLSEKGFTKVMSSHLIDASSGRTGSDYVGAFAEPFVLSWSTLSRVVETLSQIYGDLANGGDLETVSSYLPNLVDDPEYARFYSIYSGIRALPITSTPMSLYSLYELHHKDAVSADVQGTSKTKKAARTLSSSAAPLPLVTPIEFEGDSIASEFKGLFGLSKDSTPSNVRQYKYWKVSNVFCDQVDFSTIINSLLIFDRSVFGLPEYDIDLKSAIEFVVQRGAPVGLPRYPSTAPTLWEDESIKRLLGYAALSHVCSDYGDQLTSTLLGFLSAKKVTETNSTLFPKIRDHIATMVALFKAFCGFRNTLYDILRAHNEYSMISRSAEETAITLNGTRLIHRPTLQRYIDAYEGTLENLSTVPLIEGAPSSLFHISRVAAVPALFPLEASSFENAVILGPQYTRGVDGVLNIRRPFLEYQGDSALFLSVGPVPTKLDGSMSVVGAFSRLAAMTEAHSVIHYFEEPIREKVFNIGEIVRHVPIEVLEQFASAGRAQAVMMPTNDLNLNLVVSELITRSIVGFKTALGLPALQEAIMAMATPDTGDVTVEKGDIVDVIRRRYITSFSVGMIALEGGEETSIAGLSRSGSFIDTGSENFVFIFEKQNRIFTQDANSMTDPGSLPCPLFVSHESKTYNGLSILGLMSTATEPLPSGSDLEARTGYTISNKPATNQKAAEEVSTPKSVTNVNDFDVKSVNASGADAVTEEVKAEASE